MTQYAILRSDAPDGRLVDGTPIWAYGGSAGPDDGDGGGEVETDADSESGAGSDSNNDDDDSSGLERALASERQRSERRRKEAAPWHRIAREFGVKAEDVEEILRARTQNGQSQSAKKEQQEQIDVEEMRRQITREANEKVNEKLIRSALTVQAMKVLENSDDALRFLGTDYEVDDDGNVDVEQIQHDLKALLRDRPYLGKARRGDGRNGQSPDYDGGSRQGTTNVSMDDLIRRAARR